MHTAHAKTRAGARSARRIALAALLAALLPSLARAGQIEPADTALLNHVATMARQRATQIQGGAPPANAASVALYREALAEMQRGDWTAAATQLTAALARARDNPLYRGDLAFAYARLGRLDQAATEYTRAYQAQQRNAWYLAGLAAVRGVQRQWADAAGSIQLAVQSDSAVADSVIAPAAAAWFEFANDRSASLAWARIGVAKNPDHAPSWLRIAVALRARRDSTPEGEMAIRRYVTLRGDSAEKLALALMADILYNTGKTDSALTMVAVAAQDTSYREFAAQLFLQAGRDAFQRRDVDSAIALLNTGRAWSVPSQRAAFSNITGRAQLLKVQSMLADLEESRNCDQARAADSLVSQTERNLLEGVAFDSARTTMMLGVLPGFKQNVQSAIASCRPAGQAPARRPPATPARRPAPAPRPRPL